MLRLGLPGADRARGCGAGFGGAHRRTGWRPPQRGGEPKVQRIVTEDDAVRMEELRVRGQTQRIVVRSKLPGVPAYQIGTAADGRDLTQDRRSEGRSLWQLFSF